MKYKILSSACLAFLVFCFGCGSTSGNNRTQKDVNGQRKLKVLSTTAIVADLVSEVGGDQIEHQILISGDIDPHSYELVKGDDEKFSKADVIFANGLGLEHGASVRYWVDKHPRAICLGDIIREIASDEIILVEGNLDPHVWMDISLWSLALAPVAETLSALDPEHAELYQARAEKYREQLYQLDNKLKTLFQEIPAQKRFLVTCHDAFNYFTRAYLAEKEELDWQRRFTAPEGLAPDGQLSPVDIRRIVDHLCEHQVFVVFPELNLSRDALRKIRLSCKELNHFVTISSDALYGDTLGSKESHADTYIKMMEHNSEVLLRNWGSHAGK